MKTSELTGVALDWAVAKALGFKDKQFHFVRGYHSTRKRHIITQVMVSLSFRQGSYDFSPHDSWADGGPIIEREDLCTWISAEPEKGKWAAANRAWMDLPVDSEEFHNLPDPWHGPTPLIAAMRCFVASKLGDEVELPEELK